jgi:hypothetical protein
MLTIFKQSFYINTLIFQILAPSPSVTQTSRPVPNHPSHVQLFLKTDTIGTPNLLAHRTVPYRTVPQQTVYRSKKYRTICTDLASTVATKNAIFSFF